MNSVFPRSFINKVNTELMVHRNTLQTTIMCNLNELLRKLVLVHRIWFSNLIFQSEEVSSNLIFL